MQIAFFLSFPPSLCPLTLVRDVLCRQAGIFLGLQMIDQTCHPWLGLQGKKDGRLMRRDAECVHVRASADSLTSLRVTMCRLCTALRMNLSKQPFHCVHAHRHTHTHGLQIHSILGFSHSTSAVSIPPSSCTCIRRPSLFLMASLVFSPSQGTPFIMVTELTSMLALAWENAFLPGVCRFLDQKK